MADMLSKVGVLKTEIEIRMRPEAAQQLNPSAKR